MLKFGTAPFLECSSKGDKRFSAFYARLSAYNFASIEEIYQAAKKFEGGFTGLSIMKAKGRKPINQDACKELYSNLWDSYFHQEPQLLEVIKQFNGFSDIYGQVGHCCQAEEIYRIRFNG
jgi:hypothetical protein